jgi:hypothetical protein
MAFILMANGVPVGGATNETQAFGLGARIRRELGLGADAVTQVEVPFNIKWGKDTAGLDYEIVKSTVASAHSVDA